MFHIKITHLSKTFDLLRIFHDLSIQLITGESLAVLGPNGSGKSTFLKILAGFYSPTEGSADFFQNEEKIPGEKRTFHFGYLSSEINPYEELSGEENIQFIAQEKNFSGYSRDDFLTIFEIHPYKKKQVKYYSSGMKQRLKIILSLINDPPILLFDEPATNLDPAGKRILFQHLNRIRKDKIIIIATNENQESEFCEKKIVLNHEHQ